MDCPTVDVVVIGGGAAGLAAARRLNSAGLRVTLMEARNRMGGRVHTIFDSQWPLPIERGAEFIHGRPPETWDIVQAAGLVAYDIRGESWRRAGGRMERADRQWEQMQTVLDRLEGVGTEDLSFAQFLESHCPDLPSEAKLLASRYVEGFNAADQTLISAQFLREAERAERAVKGDRLFRLVGGYGHVLEWLHTGIDPAQLDLRLGAIVSAITWQPGHVRIESHSITGTPLAPCEAACAIITLPVGVLQSPPGTLGSVRFSPELPEKQKALGQLKMGPVVKLVLRFDQAFWEQGDLDRADFLLLPDEPFPTWWTCLPLRLPILTGWAGGPAAERLSRGDDLAILDEGLGVLSRLLGVPRQQLDARLRAWHVSNWQADPFARGAYSYVLVGGLGAVAELARPVENTLYFAGEATQEGFSGTVASAIASGYRAADAMVQWAASRSR